MAPQNILYIKNRIFQQDRKQSKNNNNVTKNYNPSITFTSHKNLKNFLGPLVSSAENVLYSSRKAEQSYVS